MKAVLLTGTGELTLGEAEKPVIREEGQVLLKIDAAGICGSDIHYYKQGKIGSDIIEFPFIIGHECAATVEQVGKKVSNLKPGDKVVVEPAISCGTCDQCRADRKNTCRNLKFLGCPGQLQGCLCEYIIMPQENCYPYDERLDVGGAVICEPLAIAIYAVRQSQLKQTDTCAILGVGPVGLSVLVYSALHTDKIYVTDRIAERLEAAANNGAIWTGNCDRQGITEDILKSEPDGIDVVFECAGEQQAIDQAIEILKPGGKLMIIGIPADDKISFDIHKLRRKEITIVNVRRQNDCTQEAIDLISSGKIDTDFMLTHRFSPEQATDAFDLVAGYRDGAIKTTIEF